MSNTTSANVLAIAPELSGLPQDTIDLILLDVADQVTEAVFGTKQEKAQRYLAAHLLTLIKQASEGGGKAGPVVTEKTGDVSVTYANPAVTSQNRYDLTAYGQEYNNIRKGCVVGFMVVTP